MIQRIRIQNFRSLRDVTVDLDPLTVLIGRSGTGKSNFVRAARTLRDIVRVGTIWHMDYGANISINPKYVKMGFRIEFYAGKDYVYELIIQASNSIERESLSVGGEPLFVREGGSFAPEFRGLLQYRKADISGSVDASLFLPLIEGKADAQIAYAALRSGLACYDFPTDIFFNKPTNGVANSGLLDNGSNAIEVLAKIIAGPPGRNGLPQLINGCRAINPRLHSIAIGYPVGDSAYVTLKNAGRQIDVNVREESEGFRRYLATMIALYQVPSTATMLFEHPETALHPAVFSSLADELILCPEQGRGQVIFTTHSPILLDRIPVESIRVVDFIDGETKIGRLDREQLSDVKDSLLRTGELLTVEDARIDRDPVGIGA